MIEISNEELSKVLNLWTETEEWESGSAGWLHWSNMAQRRADGSLIPPCGQDKEAHALVNFMLKERKYPRSMVTDVFYPNTYTNNPEVYIEWVKAWEKKFGDKPQDDQPKEIDHCEASEQLVVDHSIPVRYGHLISTEELVKRAQERWPDDGWQPYEGGGGVPADNVCDNRKGKVRYWYLEGGYVAGIKLQPPEQRTKLLTLIGEVKVPLQSDKTTPKSLLIEDPKTKAERFYAFLATPQPDISPGLWGLEREPEAPVRGGDDLGWARENMGAATYSGKAGWTIPDTKGMTRNWRALVTVEV